MVVNIIKFVHAHRSDLPCHSVVAVCGRVYAAAMDARRQPKVHNLERAIPCKTDILRLEISEDMGIFRISFVVQIAER